MFCSQTVCGDSFMLMRKTRRARRKRSDTRATLALGMRLTFRAELMPGRETTERTFEVTRVLANGRVELANLQGQHSIAEFEFHSRPPKTIELRGF